MFYDIHFKHNEKLRNRKKNHQFQLKIAGLGEANM